MSHQKINNLAYLQDKRKQLRNNATPAEARLWLALKNSALHNRKFRRQHSLGNYIADFYCPAEKLIVELDGEVHNDPMQSIYDAEREQCLRALGCKIIRFENSLVFTQIENVLFAIAAQFKRD
jgi:very-short-patch-repair endonuclease